MVDGRAHLDPYEKPPDVIRVAFKRLQKVRSKDLDTDDGVIDFRRGLTTEQRDRIIESGVCDAQNLNKTFAPVEHDEGDGSSANEVIHTKVLQEVLIYDFVHIPGKLHIWVFNRYAELLVSASQTVLS